MLEYSSPVQYLNSSGDIKQLKSVQHRAARWVCGSWWNPVNTQRSKSSDCCLNQLEWPLLHQRQIYFTICQIHNTIHHLSAIPFTQYFSTDNRHSNPSALDTSISTIGFPFLSTLLFCGTKYPTDQRPQTIPCCPQTLSFLTQCCFLFICFVLFCWCAHYVSS